MVEKLHDSGAGLTYQDAMPLRLRTVDGPEAVLSPAQLASRNEMLLRVSIAMQDHHEVEERGDYSAELARLDLKMDLIIACLQPLLAASSALPGPVPVTLTPERVRWPATCGALIYPDAIAEPGPAESLSAMAELYINPVVPIPLSLTGTLKRTTSPEAGWEMVFDPPGEAQTDLLEKLIFRYHRHAVATSARKPAV